MENTIPICQDPTCPCIEEHAAVPFNLQLCMNNANRTFKLPQQVRGVLIRIALNPSERFLDQDFAEWEFLARFAMVHRCWRTGLMPAQITKHKVWKHEIIRAILATAKDPEVKAINFEAKKPVVVEAKKAPVKPAKIEETTKKMVLPVTGRRFAMGRGVNLNKAFTPGYVDITPPGTKGQVGREL